MHCTVFTAKMRFTKNQAVARIFNLYNKTCLIDDFVTRLKHGINSVLDRELQLYSEYNYTLKLYECNDKSTCCVCCRSSLPGSLPVRLASLVNSRLNWHVAVTRQVAINSLVILLAVHIVFV